MTKREMLITYFHFFSKMKSLDKKDRLLLAELDFNSRATYAQLGKAARMSKQGVEYRLSRFFREEIITQFYPVVNSCRLGYLYCRLLVTLRTVTKEQREAIERKIVADRRSFWVFRMHGMYDLLVAGWFRSATEFAQFREWVEDTVGGHIHALNETIATDVVHLPHRFLLKGSRHQEVHLREDSERVGIGEDDHRILRELCKDARTAMLRIGDAANLSAKVVAYRIRRMERLGVIAGYRPVLDYGKLGLTYYKLFVSLNDAAARSAVTEYVKQQPCVIYMVHGVGLPADLDIEVLVASNEDLIQFIEDLRFRFPAAIGDYKTVIFLKTLKVRYLPF